LKMPFKIGRKRDEVLEKLDEIKFTGSDTRIARAVDLALAELTRARRHDAIQVYYY
uniref:AAA_lid_3 domain-containing protein n=1 Tax=Gongylonema pulchrum TaxID=637853 RepID=A0A183EN89_9BILA